MAQISSGSGIVKQPYSSRSIEISVDFLDEEDLLESIASFREKNNKGIVGIIVNSVRRAMNTGAFLSQKFGAEHVVINHSRFLSVDRLMKDAKVLELGGKDSDREKFTIIIGTQVLEQSLDLDFDILYTDIAPVASLMQRMGRLHRHDRISRKIDPKLVILKEQLLEGSEIYEPTARMIYGDWLITVSELLFASVDTVKLPNQIKEFVEWLPEGYADNHIYRNFIESNKNLRTKKTRDFTLKRPPEARKNRSDKTKQQSLHGCFSINQEESKYGNLIEAKVRNIDQPTIEVIALFEGNHGGLFVPIYENNKRKEFYIEVDENFDSNTVKNILSSTIKLPHQCSNLEFIEYLENYAQEKYSSFLCLWKNNKILKDELFMVFQNDSFSMKNKHLIYDQEQGLELIIV